MMQITRILVPTDFSAHADAALRYAIDLAKPFGAAVHLLAVIEDPLAAGMWSSEIYSAELAGLQINLVKDTEERLQRLTAAVTGTASVSSEVRTGRVATAIVETAANAVDLIVMGTAGRTGVAHLLMGSVTERVVRSAPCPVLTLRAAATDAAQSADATRSAR
jgi:universal stress protein A